MFKNKKIGAVIINYNDIDRTLIQLNRLIKFNIFDKIIIVDNNSQESDKNKLHSLVLNKVKIIFNKENIGYGAGNNAGLKVLDKENFDYVLLINNDIVMKKESILECINFLINNKQYCVSTPLMIEKNKIKRNFYDIPTLSNTLNFISSTFSKKCKSMKTFDDHISADYVRESATIYSIKHFKQIGFFDDNIFMYEEGATCGFLFKQIGYKEAVITNTKPYIHNHIGPLINRKMFSINKKSRFYFFKKYQNYNKLKLFIFKLFWVNIFVK